MGSRALVLIAFVRAHWKVLAIYAGACVLCFAWGWVSHRPAAPRVEVKDRVVTQVEYRDRVVEKTVTVAAKEQTKEHVTHRHEVIAPDGTHTIDLDTGTGVQTQVNVGQIATVSLTEQGTETSTRETSVVQTPAPLPRWRVGALVGLGTSGMVYGGEGSYRLLGPVSVGAWALSSPAGGVSLSVEF